MPDNPPVEPWQRAAFDQFEAARLDAQRIARDTLAAHDGVVVDSGAIGSWCSAIMGSVALPAAPTVCAHLARNGLSIRPTFVLAPRILGCRDCWDLVLNTRRDSDHERRCERCGRTASPALDVVIMVAQRGLLVAMGELCATCVTHEFLGV